MPAHFGLEISNTSIKVAQAHLTEKGFELTAFGEAKLPVSFQADNPADHQTISQTLKDLLVNTKIDLKEVYIGLPEAYAYTRVIQLPVLTDHELKQAIRYEAEQYIPIPLEEVYLEYQILFSPEAAVPGATMDVLLVAAKKNSVDKVMRIVEGVSLMPLVMETCLLSALRALEPQLEGYGLLVDIGDISSDIAIINQGTLKQTSSLSTGGQAITRAIAQNLSLGLAEARKYKHTYGLKTDQLEGRVAAAMKGPVSDIINHIGKNIRFIHSITKEAHTDKIVLSGGTALLPNFTHHLVQQLGVEVILANPLANCVNKSLPKQLVTVAPRFSAVIGLAIRE